MPRHRSSGNEGRSGANRGHKLIYHIRSYNDNAWGDTNNTGRTTIPHRRHQLAVILLVILRRKPHALGHGDGLERRREAK